MTSAALARAMPRTTVPSLVLALTPTRLSRTPLSTPLAISPAEVRRGIWVGGCGKGIGEWVSPSLPSERSLAAAVSPETRDPEHAWEIEDLLSGGSTINHCAYGQLHSQAMPSMEGKVGGSFGELVIAAWMEAATGTGLALTRSRARTPTAAAGAAMCRGGAGR